MNLRKFLAVLMVGCMLSMEIFPAAVVFAATATQSQYNQAKQSERRAKILKDRADRKANIAKGKMNAVVAQLGALQRQLNNLKRKSAELSKKQAANEIILQKKEKELKLQKELYCKRLREIYEHGEINYMNVLLGADDFGDFASRMYLLRKIIGSDLDLVEKVYSDMEAVEEQQKIIKEQQAENEKMQAEIKVKEASAKKIKEQRSVLLYKAVEEQHKSAGEYERRKKISANIGRMLQSMEAQNPMPAQNGSGRFMWPCQGRITSPYGWRVHPVFKTRKFHSGVDIGVGYGTPIKAAGSGRVVYSGWIGGYGNTVMINHGGGLVSLYAHNSSCVVREGQNVNKGQVIAKAGSTGYSTGPHCHLDRKSVV